MPSVGGGGAGRMPTVGFGLSLIVRASCIVESVEEVKSCEYCNEGCVRVVLVDNTFRLSRKARLAELGTGDDVRKARQHCP